MHIVLDAEQAELGLARVATQLAACSQDLPRLVLVGIRRGGVPLAARLAELLRQRTGVTPALGSVDITLYRDDAATALPNPRLGPSQIPTSLDHKWVLLVDDVLYTRRTIRAALDALLDYGRPEKIELFALIDRAGKQLPIQPDYWVLKLDDLSADDRVDVVEDQGRVYAVVQHQSAPSLPPGKMFQS